jgi:hypothetical protein
MSQTREEQTHRLRRWFWHWRTPPRVRPSSSSQCIFLSQVPLTFSLCPQIGPHMRWRGVVCVTPWDPWTSALRPAWGCAMARWQKACVAGQRVEEGTLCYGHSRCGMAPYLHHNPLRLFYFPAGNLLSSVLCDGHFLCLDLQGDWSQLSLMYYRSMCIIYFFSFLVIWFDQSVIQLVKTVASDDDWLMFFAS